MTMHVFVTCSDDDLSDCIALVTSNVTTNVLTVNNAVPTIAGIMYSMCCTYMHAKQS